MSVIPVRRFAGTAGVPPANAPQVLSFCTIPTFRASRSFCGRVARGPSKSLDWSHKQKETRLESCLLRSSWRCCRSFQFLPRLRTRRTGAAGLTSPACTVGVGCGGVAPLGIIHNSTQSSSRNPPFITVMRD